MNKTLALLSFAIALAGNFLGKNIVHANKQLMLENIFNEKSPFEVRALIDNIEQVRRLLSTLNAEFKGSYAFQDYIYHPQDQDYDLNKECVRVRIYQKTNWNQKKVEFAHKLKSVADRSASIKFKMQFDSFEETDIFLVDYKLAFSFHRNGFEYALDGMRIFVEEIQGLSPSIEVVSDRKEKIDQLFAFLTPKQILTDSIPKLVENKNHL